MTEKNEKSGTGSDQSQGNLSGPLITARILPQKTVCDSFPPRSSVTVNFRPRNFSRNPESFRDHFSMWQNSDSQRIDASYLFIMERPTEPWLQKQIDEESEFFNDIYQVSNMKIYNATSEGFNFARGLNFSHASRFESRVGPPSPWNPNALNL